MPTELKLRTHRRPLEPSRLGAIVDGATNTLVCPGGIVAAFHAAQALPPTHPVVHAAVVSMAGVAAIGLGTAYLMKNMQTYRGPALRARYFAAALATGIAGYAQIDNEPVAVVQMTLPEKAAARLSENIKAGGYLPFCQGGSLEPAGMDVYTLKTPRYCAYFFGARPMR